MRSGKAIAIAAICAALSVSSAAKTAVAAEMRVLNLSSQLVDGKVEIAIIGSSDAPVSVSYKLSVVGQSTTQHSGRTTLSGSAEKTLSRVMIAGSDDWCATLDVEQSDGTNYQLTEGNC